MSLFDSTAKDAKLRSAAKKLAAGLHVPQSSNEVNDVMEIISRNISADISNNVDEDPDVDLAVHTLQSRATSSIEFATNYDKLADKNINRVVRDYNDIGNRDAVRNLALCREDLSNTELLNFMLIALMVVSFTIDIVTLNKPLRESPKPKLHAD